MVAMKYTSILFLLCCFVTWGQETNRFQKEVETIQKKYDTIWIPSQKTIVFTGSSSIRLWSDLNKLFPDDQIVNTGFGGSESTDLLLFSKELILNFNPYKVFIYEGDNDIASKKKPKEIINTIEKIVHSVWLKNNNTKIILVSAKPSIARWSLKRRYKRLNRKLKRLSKKQTSLYFADVWTPMLHGKKLKKDLFVEDGLHMNSKGYEIWHSVIKPYMNE